MAGETMTIRDEPRSTASLRHDGLAEAGRWAANYALAVIFLVFGASKFAPMAGKELAPLIMNSPLVSWWHGVFGVDGTATALGAFEILTGLLVAARPFSPRLSMVGGAMAVATFLVTLSFLLSTPGVSAGADPLPLSMLGQFLLKDLVLLAVALWIFGASRAEANDRQGRGGANAF